ncbi:MAG: histidinol-phosphate transaminase [Nitrospirae bacterium]|nr:histidinol-phosphate transaminase [Nitrospirota bacterium]
MKLKIPENIQKIIPYKAGKPIEELKREMGLNRIIKLASNENPLGPSPMALKAISQFKKSIFLYPDGNGYDLVLALAERLKVFPSQVALGNGSNELIELLTRAFLLPGDEVIMADLTFSLYSMMTEVAHAKVVTVPLKADRHDLGTMAAKITDRTRMIFICNPNNPTGTLLPRHEIMEFINQVSSDIVLVFDHAYEEYVTDATYSNLIGEINRHENIVILRTFSKLYGLAGLRIGYGIGSEKMIETLNKVRQPFNTNLLSQKAALAALGDEFHLRASRQNNIDGKNYLYPCFDEMRIKYVPTETNFIFFEVEKGPELFDWMLKEGIIIRHIKGKQMRVTIGKPDENKKFTLKLKQFLRLQT